MSKSAVKIFKKPANAYLYSKQKRTLDILFSLLALPVVIPVLILCALLVFLTMGWPIIFAQRRVGKDGSVFVIYKLRSLKRSSNNHEGITHVDEDVTSVGKIMRLFRFDELPQIWNILKGDMSWVGPRPEVPVYVEQSARLNPRFNDRLQALPGITGLAQLNNPNATPNDNLDKLKHDMEYIHKASLGLDIRIIFKSFFFIWK
jgi:lipopolysaccharide/colanic/teichoic acid biosynthesis glycosyltransferase